MSRAVPARFGKPCAAARAIGRLVTVRDELELAARPPGERIEITRQALDSMVNDLAIVGRLIRVLAEGGHHG